MKFETFKAKVSKIKQLIDIVIDSDDLFQKNIDQCLILDIAEELENELKKIKSFNYKD